MAQQRVRRRIEHEEPATPPSIRRLYWYGGAALGVLAGVLVALFVVPPIFDRYFGVADIALGHEYRADAAIIRVERAGAAAGDPARFEVVLAVRENHSWCPTASDFRLELEGRVSIGAPRLEPDTALCAAAGTPFQGTTLTLSFPAGGRDPADLRVLHVADPRVRFWLQPGEPGE